MKVKSLIRLQHTKVSPDTYVALVWQLLAKRNITLLSVVSAEGKLLGVIGEDDLLVRLVPDYRENFSEFLTYCPNLEELEENLKKAFALIAKDVMNKKIISIKADEPIYKALSKMMAYRVRVLPVIDEEKNFLGMIVEDDIMQYLFKAHQHIVKKGKKLK